MIVVFVLFSKLSSPGGLYLFSQIIIVILNLNHIVNYKQTLNKQHARTYKTAHSLIHSEERGDDERT